MNDLFSEYEPEDPFDIYRYKSDSDFLGSEDDGMKVVPPKFDRANLSKRLCLKGRNKTAIYDEQLNTGSYPGQLCSLV